MLDNPSKTYDDYIADTWRNQFKRGTEAPLFDLISSNIQRGRDHATGIPGSKSMCFDLVFQQKLIWYILF